MNKIELLELMSNPAQLANIPLATLLEITEEFPYFPTAYLLIARKITQSAPPVTNDDTLLSHAATYASSREMMYKLLNKPISELSRSQPFEAALQYSSVGVGITTKEAETETNNNFEDELDDAILANNLGLNRKIEEDDFAEKPTESISIPDKFFHEETQLETRYIEQEMETEDVREIYNRLMEKTENRLEEVAQKTEETVAPISSEILLGPKDKQREYLTGTAEIARLQVEQELKEVVEIPTVYGDSDTADLSSLLEAEAREIIRHDVERDLESLKKSHLLDDSYEQQTEEQPEIPTLLGHLDEEESQNLLQSLKEKVELFKKEKTPLPPIDDNKQTQESNWQKNKNEEIQPELTNTLTTETPINEPTFLNPTLNNELPPLPLKDEDEQAIKGFVGYMANNQNDNDTDITHEELYLSTADIEQQKAQGLSNTESILSETMARVYARQGYFDKAIQIYEQLQAKFPEKNTYFAEKIEQLKKN